MFHTPIKRATGADRRVNLLMQSAAASARPRKGGFTQGDAR